MTTIKTPRKVFVVGRSHEYVNWMDSSITSNMIEADFVVFTGGEDVDPSLYKKKPHPTTSSNIDRDIREMAAFSMARKLEKPMVGICRGSQFLCVMAGGILVQHQAHPARHKITIPNGTITVTSSHHQRQFPFFQKLDWNLLGWCKLSPYSYGEPEEKLDKENMLEVEIAYYKGINALAIQSHPEWQYLTGDPSDEQAIEHFRGLLDRLLSGKLHDGMV